MSTSVFLTQTNASIFPRRSHYTLKDRSISATSHAQPVYSAKPLHSPEAKKPVSISVSPSALAVPVATGVALGSTVLATNASITNTAPTASGVKNQKVEPTAGMKIFDALVYSVFNNFLVFAISVYATYLTAHGNKVADAKSFFDIGHVLKTRGDKFVGWLKGEDKLFNKIPSPLKFDPKTAEMAKMVTFSFVDGTAVAVLVSLLENNSSTLSKNIDNWIGTPQTPQTEQAYAQKAEHKQTLGTLFAGRLATCAIVVPTAVILNKKTTLFSSNAKARSFNELLFNRPGLMVGLKLKKDFPQLQDKFPNIKIPSLLKTAFFEAFYTSVCTLGLYISSRFFAGPVADFIRNTQGQSTTTTPPKTTSTLPPQYA
jgi:hypothetical protein